MPHCLPPSPQARQALDLDGVSRVFMMSSIKAEKPKMHSGPSSGRAWSLALDVSPGLGLRSGKEGRAYIFTVSQQKPWVMTEHF